MSNVTDKRVIVATLFLPHTVDFHIKEQNRKKLATYTTSSTVDTHFTVANGDTTKNSVPTIDESTSGVPNLIQSLVARHNHYQQQKKQDLNRNSNKSVDELFDFAQPEKLVQPKSKKQLFEEEQQQDKKNEGKDSVSHSSLSANCLSSKVSSLPSISPVNATAASSSYNDDYSCPRLFEEATWSVKPCTMGNIGLNNALFSIQNQLVDLAWVGTLGMPTDPLSQKTKDDISTTLEKEYSSYVVMPNDTVFDEHYNQYCKQVLWPYFHYVVQDELQNMMYQDKPYKSYKDLNQQYADKIVQIYKEGDLIWINDYHLMLLPGMIRKMLPNATIGFFLHIPFPSSEIFRCLPCKLLYLRSTQAYCFDIARKYLLEAMLQSDVIGFQTYSFARHFLQTCSRILSVDATPLGVQLDTHYCSVHIHPIGIDVLTLNQKIGDPQVAQWMTKLKEKYADKKLIVARDKLDYIKGVRQKLLAYEDFLTRHPEWHGKVVLIQIALSTSEQNELRAHISDVVSRVNANFSNFSYQPIVFLHQDISFPQYLALLSVADACLLTPLRDGMNLTSHEYIVCQKETYNPLILSEFTGTYGSFGASIRVNPWDYKQVGDAIHEALLMNQEEKVARWKELYKSIETNSAQQFAQNIIAQLSKVHATTMGRRFSGHIPRLQPDTISKATESRLNGAGKRLILLGYGGTLIPHGKPPSAKDLSRITHLLAKLTSNPKNAVYIVSGRTKSNMETDLGSIPNLGLSAENGFYLKYRGKDGWQQVYDNVDFSWKPAVREIFQYYTERTPGAYVETKDTSIVWHYQSSDNTSQYASWQAAECQNHIADSVNKNFAVHTVIGNTTIEVLPHDLNKSSIVTRIIQHEQEGNNASTIDFILAIGDDRSDEDLFHYLKNHQTILSSDQQQQKVVITCTVGRRSTEANYFVANVEAVLDTLEQNFLN
ncbi:glycosyltransferase family 20-domain-containing protein [Mycotypha africana]|uniref:glycosyltransferase family 20-domain-containing protein n=1 Tax=Mycotypha africana TaxID=64632 RepID=UPI002301D1D3|nr:glycosyltransferase family 20-domain-containing protein [Mycotypha africana]KAI8977044.1 glycosyltransferase family 20-domain-containing protein [Mycotypha africana]